MGLDFIFSKDLIDRANETLRTFLGELPLFMPAKEKVKNILLLITIIIVLSIIYFATLRTESPMPIVYVYLVASFYALIVSHFWVFPVIIPRLSRLPRGVLGSVGIILFILGNFLQLLATLN